MPIKCHHIESSPVVESASGSRLLKFFDSIEEIKSCWDDCCPNDHYWQSNYHTAVENALPKGLHPHYCLVFKDEELVGTIYMQHKKINLAESIRLNNENLMSKIYKRLLLSNLNMDTLVVGNLLLTGKYGFHFTEALSIEEQYEILNLAIEAFCAFIKKRGIKIGPVLLKDFFEDQVYPKPQFENFSKFAVQPNMIMELHKEWGSLGDYSNALKAKSRTRYNRARHKFENIEGKIIELHEIEARYEEMYALYSNIADNVDFNLFFLDKKYFINLKKQLGEDFIVKAYFGNDGHMVGFFTMLKNYDHLDAHFLGYDPECNKNCQLYLNMLFDMVDYGTYTRLSKINMSRTAMEIKSSVGAKPYKMFCYLKHRGSFLNRFVPKIVSILYKEVIWEERNPFK
jgi:hypothetical protein